MINSSILFFSYVHISVVFAISTSCSIRVANLLGAQQAYLAKTAAWLSVYFSTLVILFFAVCIYFGHRTIAIMFTSDQAVIDRISSIATIVSAFQIVYGLQSSLQGCLRGMGYQLSLAGYNFF
jgi:MATE family multidrug resistance protein